MSAEKMLAAITLIVILILFRDALKEAGQWIIQKMIDCLALFSYERNTEAVHEHQEYARIKDRLNHCEDPRTLENVWEDVQRFSDQYKYMGSDERAMELVNLYRQKEQNI